RAETRRLPIAEIIAVGSELLLGGRTDSNSLSITEDLGSLGIEVRFKSIVGDNQTDIVRTLKTAVSRAKVIVMTGGLGPTVDDCTREAIAAAAGRKLARRPEALRAMQERLAQWGRSPNQGQLRQALIPAGATVVPNPIGSAPGFWLSWQGALLVSLPGVPSEMTAMMRGSVVPLLASWVERRGQVPQPIRRHLFHTWGLPEAEIDAKLHGLIPKNAPVDLGLLASPLGVLVSLTTKAHTGAAENASRSWASLTEAVRGRLHEWIFAEGSESMEEVVGRLLLKEQHTIALAESCTGGLIGHRLTQVPGSSAYVDRGIICYSNKAKVDLLGVPADLIERHGAVSAEVAAAMATGIRERSGVSIGLSVTGIAGPGGATATKPVGLVYVGLNVDTGDSITREHRFHGDRSVIKQRSSQAALDLLRRWLLASGR
ncbi:MAG TPA: competence/damage-inducible protein A, partial [Nitrospira sp.]|nr:competence/damage-inducible protein A [Nitrospira sp.]